MEKTKCENCNRETSDLIGTTYSEEINTGMPNQVPKQYKASVVFICCECRAVKRVI